MSATLKPLQVCPPPIEPFSKEALPLKNLPRTLLRSVRLHDPLAVRPIKIVSRQWGEKRALQETSRCLAGPSGSFVFCFSFVFPCQRNSLVFCVFVAVPLCFSRGFGGCSEGAKSGGSFFLLQVALVCLQLSFFVTVHSGAY